MSQDHDPLLQAQYLRQCLAHDKRPIGLFLGAGCPMAVRIKRGAADEPLIPDIAGMTSIVFAELQKSALKGPYEVAFSHFAMDGRPTPNIEEFLSHLRSLGKVAGKDSVRGLSAKDINEIDSAVCEILVRVAGKDLPHSGTAYHSLAAWIGAVERASPVEVFTTNYDLLIEEALETNRAPYFDGFVGSRSTFLDLQSMEDGMLPPRWNRVWKIHGSLNWYEDDGGNVHRGLPAGCLPTGKRRVIYPSHLKYDESRRMPYLCMIDRLRYFFKNAAPVLITCGFSFGDQHLNEVLVQGLQGNPGAIVFALLYDDLSRYPQITALAQNRINLNVLARDRGMIGTRVALWTQGKDASSCTDTTAIKWVPDPANGTIKNAQFSLGDFGSLALFAKELIGEHV
jgi:SIR2-like domain